MKKVLLVIAAVAALAGCSTAQQQTAQQQLAKAQQLIVEGCTIVQPTLASVQLMDPAIAPFVVANGAFCAAQNTINVASIQTMVSTSIPAAINLISTSTLIPADQKPAVIGGMTAFQIALSGAMIVIEQNMPATPATPASSPAVPTK
jgi:hypothetical protein